MTENIHYYSTQVNRAPSLVKCACCLDRRVCLMCVCLSARKYTLFQCDCVCVCERTAELQDTVALSAMTLESDVSAEPCKGCIDMSKHLSMSVHMHTYASA